MKPSDRINEIHRALKILDGHNPEDKDFAGITYFEKAILKYLDEVKTEILRCAGSPTIGYKSKPL